MSGSLERYYSALLARGRANNPTIREAKRDLQRYCFQFDVSGGALRL